MRYNYLYYEFLTSKPLRQRSNNFVEVTDKTHVYDLLDKTNMKRNMISSKKYWTYFPSQISWPFQVEVGWEGDGVTFKGMNFA